MNKEILKKIGIFKKEVKAFEEGFCPFCGICVDPNSFRDERSARELKISGLCQPCQDKTFGK